MEYTQIEIENHFDGKLKIAYLNQPETFNSLNKAMLKELKYFVETSNKEEQVRCLAISGRGKAFCSGQNLKEALQFDGHQHDINVVQRIVIEYYNPLVTEISKSKKPIISLVNGPAVGAGAMLALICDFTLATESAYFSQAFSGIGLIPDTGGTYYLPKLLGKQLANYLAFTGKKLSSQEAQKLGLIAECFSDETFAEKAMEVLFQVSNMPTKALYLTKKAFNESYENSLAEQLDLEGIYQQKASESEDFREGVTAFVEKRKPVYKGK